MDFTAIFNNLKDLWTEYPVQLAVGVFIIVLIIWRIFNTIRIYFGAKSYVKKTNKLRRKKFNGVSLVSNIKKKRKKNTNTYKQLRMSGRSKVEKFFQYKEDELPGITNFSYSKMFKRNKNKIIIFVSDGRKKVMKIHMKKARKSFITLTNKYECLDEFIVFLHNLPEAIIAQQEYDIYITEKDVSIGYEIK